MGSPSRKVSSEMLTDEVKFRVAAATVLLPEKGGQGVLVSGGFILTAAHCVDWDFEDELGMMDHHVERVDTRDGLSLKVGPCSVDPLTDIAALGALDGEEFYEESQAFEHFCDNTPCVPLHCEDLAVGNPCPSIS